jgi:hypothetical protein
VQLPDHVQLVIIGALDRCGVASLAQTHSTFAALSRQLRSKVTAAARSNNDAQFINKRLALYPSDRLKSLCIECVPGPNNTPAINMRLLSLPALAALELRAFALSPRVLAALSTSAPRLRELTLTPRPEKRLNVDGSLSALAALTVLTSLSLAALSTDEGLQALTQARSLPCPKLLMQLPLGPTAMLRRLTPHP